MNNKFNNDDIFGFETDTVWGLGCSVNSESAVDKIYEIKGRDRTKPLILMSNRLENLLSYVESPSPAAILLMKKYFPGALTVIFKKSKKCPDYICEGKQTVGIRIPDNHNFWQLCENVKGNVLATTSLNKSSEPPVLNFEEAKLQFGQICTVLEPKNPKTLDNLPSTIVDFSTSDPKILRQGSVNLEAIFFL